MSGVRRILFAVIVFVCCVLAGAPGSSAQDLGALARQEQLRKQSLPSHAGHVYTNDDLVKPRILVPEDVPDSVPENRPESQAVAPPTAPQPVSASLESPAVPIQVSTQLPLGDIARQYRERKMARQEESLRAVRPVQSTHVYNNEDMVRPEILTPEDHALFEAQRNITLPGVGEHTAEILLPEITVPEIGIDDARLPEVPLGDIAREYQKRETPPEPQEPSRFQFSWNTVSFASPILRERPSPPGQPSKLPRPLGVRGVLHPSGHLSNRRRGDQQSAEARRTSSETVTVRRGDSLWKLARLYLGQGSQWRALVNANPWIKNPDYLKVGAQIRI